MNNNTFTIVYDPSVPYQTSTENNKQNEIQSHHFANAYAASYCDCILSCLLFGSVVVAGRYMLLNIYNTISPLGAYFTLKNTVDNTVDNTVETKLENTL